MVVTIAVIVAGLMEAATHNASRGEGIRGGLACRGGSL